MTHPEGRYDGSLWADRRMGGMVRYRIVSDPGETLVRVPENIQKCVCFIYSNKPDGRRVPRGTAVFIAAPRADGLDGFWAYLATARHVIAGIRATSPDGMSYLRCNTLDGVEWVEKPRSATGW